MADIRQSEIWDRVTKRLIKELGSRTFKTWISPLRFVSQGEGVITIEVPTSFVLERIRSQFLDRIQTLCHAEDSFINNVNLIIASNGSTDQFFEPKKDITPITITAARDSEDEISSLLNPRYTFENFVVGKSNDLAYAAARRVSESNQVQFNPLYLYGGVGLGKTHLMHAIAWDVRKQSPNRRVIYLSAERFMFEFIKAIRHNGQISFKEKFRSVDILMIDDVQFISGKNSTQEEFFHTFNEIVDNNRQIIISADRSPSNLDGVTERTRSRLGWGLVADIHQTDYELRLGILMSKSEQFNIDVSALVIEFLAHRITSNIRELEGALNRVVAFAQLVGRPVTIEMAQNILKDVLYANDRQVTIEDIQKKVAEHYGMQTKELLSQRRTRDFVRPRQIAMYLAKTLTTNSLPEIGKRFAGRDHATVIHAVKKINQLMVTDNELCQKVETLKKILQT